MKKKYKKKSSKLKADLPTFKKPKKNLIYVLETVHTEITEVADENDDWRSDSTCESHSLIGLTEENTGISLGVPFEVEVGKKYYILYVDYSTGDSFHREDGKRDYVELYDKIEFAEKSLEIIKKNENYAVEIYNSIGIKYRICCSWVGYFESVENISIEEVTFLK